MRRRAPFLIPLVACQLVAQAPLRVDLPQPAELDLRQADTAALVPRDNRDAAQVDAARRAWTPLIAALRSAPALRLRLPEGAARLPLLLAASQALKAQNPAVRLYVAFDPQATPILDETAWGAVDGGALLPGDLGPDPAAWRNRLTQAQTFFPGRPWTLWLPTDPGPLVSTLMGDGGRVVVPPGGPGARLAEALPAGFTEVEGGRGDLTLRNRTGDARRWTFAAGAWTPTPLPRERTEVAVTAANTYDVGALLAKIRAAQLRDRAAIHTLEAKADLDLHIQAPTGQGGDLGFRFSDFEKAGEWPELLQKEVLLNGVKAKLAGEVQLPLIESRQSMSLPVALGLTERYRYRDGGPAGPGRRRLTFEPVDADPLLYRGDLVADEATGQVLEEHRERTNLPGTVKSEREILTYGEVAPGVYRPVSIQTYERWTSAHGVIQVQRRFRYHDFRLNAPDFDAARAAARASKATMLKVTPDGTRYFTRQADGTRRIETKPKSSGRALAGVILVDPGLTPSVVPLGGLLYFDYNAFGKGIQVNALTAILYNTASLAIPHVLGGFDLSADATAMLLKGTERPVVNGRLSDQDGVGRRYGKVGLDLGHDLGAGFRLEAQGDFRYDSFSDGDSQYRTPGYQLPPSGLTRVGTLQGSWLFRGFQVRAFHGWGTRPDGTYGLASNPQAVPDGGSFRRWGGSLGLDRELGPGLWFHGEAGWAGGRAFDRFNALDVGGLGGVVRIAGIRANAIAADRVTWEKVGLAIPTGPDLRLTLSLEHGDARSLDDQKTYGVSGLGISGDLPGFWWFTAVRVDLGLGLQSDIAGVKSATGYIALLRVF